MKHTLSRDIPTKADLKMAEAKAEAAAAIESAKELYIDVLKASHGTLGLALKTSQLKHEQIRKYRIHDAKFRAAEQEALGCKDVGEYTRMLYLLGLQHHYGNPTKARQYAGATKTEVNSWQNITKFKEMQDEIFESFVDGAREQIVRVANGAVSKVRDWQTARWAIAKWDPAYKDDPKQVNHTISVGNMTREQMEHELALLEKE